MSKTIQRAIVIMAIVVAGIVGSMWQSHTDRNALQKAVQEATDARVALSYLTEAQRAAKPLLAERDSMLREARNKNAVRVVKSISGSNRLAALGAAPLTVAANCTEWARRADSAVAAAQDLQVAAVVADMEIQDLAGALGKANEVVAKYEAAANEAKPVLEDRAKVHLPPGQKFQLRSLLPEVFAGYGIQPVIRDGRVQLPQGFVVAVGYRVPIAAILRAL